MVEKTHSIANLLFRSTSDRLACIRLIVPHAAAASPALANRIADQASMFDVDPPLHGEAIFAGLHRLHYSDVCRVSRYPLQSITG